MAEYEFKVIVNPNSYEEVSSTVTCKMDIFSLNTGEINKIASRLGGAVINNTTAVVPSYEALISMTNELLLLTIPAKLSKNKR